MDRTPKNQTAPLAASQSGFTVLEAAIALVILMVIGLGVASLFTYSISANSRADDRERGRVPVVHGSCVDVLSNARADLGFSGRMQGYDGEVGSRHDEIMAVVRQRPVY